MGDPDDIIGQTVGDGRYTIRRLVGRGGMGVVFEAVDETGHGSVAIKFLNSSAAADPEALRRFLREGRRFARVKHRNVVRILHAGRKRRPYVVSEFVRGKSLDRVIRATGPMDGDRALDIIGQVAEGLKAAHDQQVIHRDLKPENVMITDEDGSVKILDFGIAKDLTASVALTAQGEYLGTPAYSSPEQIRGDEIDERSDIFALGVMLFELVTGRLPFQGSRTTEVLDDAAVEQAADSSRVDAGSASCTRLVADLVERMIDKSRRRRPKDCGVVLESVRELRSALRRASEDERRKLAGALMRIVGEER